MERKEKDYRSVKVRRNDDDLSDDDQKRFNTSSYPIPSTNLEEVDIANRLRLQNPERCVKVSRRIPLNLSFEEYERTDSPMYNIGSLMTDKPVGLKSVTWQCRVTIPVSLRRQWLWNYFLSNQIRIITEFGRIEVCLQRGISYGFLRQCAIVIRLLLGLGLLDRLGVLEMHGTFRLVLIIT